MICFVHFQVVRAPNHESLVTQSQLTAGMRAILLDWLIEVARRYRQAPETVFQATLLVDRFLSDGRLYVEG